MASCGSFGAVGAGTCSAAARRGVMAKVRLGAAARARRKNTEAIFKKIKNSASNANRSLLSSMNIETWYQIYVAYGQSKKIRDTRPGHKSIESKKAPPNMDSLSNAFHGLAVSHHPPSVGVVLWARIEGKWHGLFQRAMATAEGGCGAPVGPTPYKI